MEVVWFDVAIRNVADWFRLVRSRYQVTWVLGDRVICSLVKVGGSILERRVSEVDRYINEAGLLDDLHRLVQKSGSFGDTRRISEHGHKGT
ncbi:hypothetical protein KSP40_PGU018274 [Platanthera guangdongensis]|uniref:Uncharacterized protein n=1 Tax=Platanthera guangdongensis TaxID=2320717 RepID=A0ABR2MJR3_9ASPA